jgi:Transposase DNA-binding/Transposase DDE domain
VGVKTKPTRRQVVRDEFDGVELGDERRSKRARHVADRLAASPDASLPDAMRDRAGTEALYRHLESEDVTLHALLAPHLARTTERVRGAGLAFAIADTTAFKFTGDADREGLGPINTNDQGFLAHVTLAVSADGTRTPLGVLGVENWARTGKKTAKRPISESSRWGRGMHAAQQRVGDAALIHVADRESDIYELLAELTSTNQRFIIRAAQDRTIVPTDGNERRLFDAVRCQPIAFTTEVPLSARQKKGNAKQDRTFPSRRSRTAQLSFAARSVTLKRPERCASTLPPELPINVIHVLELGPPVGEPPVEWVLLTSEPVATEKNISFVVDGYRARWVIEEFFKSTKTGCAFESKQLESFHTLTNLFAYVLVVAYAMLLLRAASRGGHDESAEAVLTPKQLKLLRAVTRKLPAHPTAREALYALAGLGGHLKNNGDPGWRTLSKGWRKLLEYETGYDLALALGSLKK